MDIKESLSKFYEQLGMILKPYEFKVLKGRSIAIRKTIYGFNQIFFDMIKSYDFTYSNICNLRIRNDKIQEIKYKVDPYHDKNTSTILTSIISYTKQIERDDLEFELNRGNEINFEEKVSIDKWFKGFTKFMNEAGFAFFDSFKIDADFDRWFNEPVLNGTYDFSKGMLWNDSISGLIAAKLVDNPGYEDLYLMWKRELIKANEDKVVDELEKMKHYLDSIVV